MITKNKKLLSLSFLLLFILFYSSAISYILAENSSSGKELFFGPVVSGLEGTGLITSKSQSGAVPLNKTLLAGGDQETIHFTLDISQTSLKTIRSKDYLKIEGLKPYGNPGEPQLPFKSYIIALPLNSTVSSVNVSSIAYRPVFNKLDIVAHPMPVAHLPITTKTTQSQEDNIRVRKGGLTQSRQGDGACKTCKEDSFFPGNLVSYDTGKDNKNLFVYIKFFPLQYISVSGRAILVTDADITVNYQQTE